MKRFLFLIVFLLPATTIVFTSDTATAEGEPPLTILYPGYHGTLFAPMTVNMVFVGYKPGPGTQEIDFGGFFSGLSPATIGFLRAPLYAGQIRPSDVGWLFDYRPVLADSAFEDAFFGYLQATGDPVPLTSAQQMFNAEAARSLDITDNLEIDAVAVESWLGDNAPAMLGVDTTQPTVFFINWYGRSDFRFHVYVKSGDPDPDTGYDFGLDDSKKLIAYGGTPSDGPGPIHRVWFHDLSAGPDEITRNWDLSTGDLGGDGIPEYTMPPVWEYGNTAGYRPFTDLSGDLAKILRYVAIDMLFAASPAYNPLISAPLLPSDISIDVNWIPLDPVNRALAPGSLSEQYITDAVSELQPWNDFEFKNFENRYNKRLTDIERCFNVELPEDGCYGNRAGGDPYVDLLMYYQDHSMQLIDPDAAYSVPLMFFDATGLETGLLGFADGDSVGTQAYVATWTSSDILARGYGPSSTIVHEVGHHLGLSHVHDGLDYDPLTGWILNFYAEGPYFFAWTGDESASVMSYANLYQVFSQFERDSMARWMMVGYINEANQVLASIYESPMARQEDAAVIAADQAALSAFGYFIDSDYQVSAYLAKQAYEMLVAAAGRLHIPIEPEARQADVKSKSAGSFFVDPLDPYSGSRMTRPSETFMAGTEFLPEEPIGWVYQER